MMVVILLALGFVPMAAEAVLSARNERALRMRGAFEPHGDVFRIMQFAYPVAFATMTLEAELRQVTADGIVAWGAAVFLVAKGLKYWAIATLGVRWTFRVLVPPGSSRVTHGPYRWLRHPNYAAVVGELAGFALMAHAAVAGPLVVFGFGLLVLRRVAVEERALGARGLEPRSS